MNKNNEVLNSIKKLINMHKNGQLGGELMPEDARPESIISESLENYHFLTLPMALNYQRDSYKLWESAAKTYMDKDCNNIFYPKLVANMSDDELRKKLLKYKLALQPNKHIHIWRTISKTIEELCQGDIRNLFKDNDNDVVKIREFIQVKNKKSFPYLSGPKIFNYWLYVMSDYTPTNLKNRSEISVAPDTHIIQSTINLGLVTEELETLQQNRSIVSDAWKNILKGTNIQPIDVHTPMWLWSKSNFIKIHK